MARKGRPSKNRDLVIHALVKGIERGGDVDYKLTRREICAVSGLTHESSIQTPLKQLINEGKVVTELVCRKTRRPPTHGEPGPYVSVYSINKSEWRWLMRYYYPYRRESLPDSATAKRRAEFLASDFADEMFKLEQFYEIVTRLFLIWGMMLDRDTLDKIHRLLTSNQVKGWVEKWMGTMNKKETKSVTESFALIGQFFELLHNLKANQKMPADSYFKEYEKPEVMDNLKRALRYFFRMDKEVQELASLARLSPTLFSYALRVDVEEGTPPVFLFNVSKLHETVASHPTLHDLRNVITKEFKCFLWRLLFIMIMRDVIDYPQNITKRLCKKAGLNSRPTDLETALLYLVEKVARQIIPTKESLRNRLAK